MNKLAKILKVISIMREITFVLVFVNFITETIPHGYAIAFYAFLWTVEHFFTAVKLINDSQQYEEGSIIPEYYNDGLLKNKRCCMYCDIKMLEWKRIARYWQRKHTTLVKEHNDRIAKYHIDYAFLNLLAAIILFLGELL